MTDASDNLELAKEMAADIEDRINIGKTKSLGFVRTADGRLAEVQLKVEVDDWEWIDYDTAREEYGWEADD